MLLNYLGLLVTFVFIVPTELLPFKSNYNNVLKSYYNSNNDFAENIFKSDNPHIWLTINAKRYLEVSWVNARLKLGDTVVITNSAPESFIKNGKKSSEYDEYSGSGDGISSIMMEYEKSFYWIPKKGEILTVIQPEETNQWINTNIRYNIDLSHNVTLDTNCYGYYASYLDVNGNIIASGCIQAFPKWMNDMKSVVGNSRIRDLFIPGTHDSGSYRLNFNPDRQETIVTKYALTQDEDIRTQLMHGIRYLDLRVGYYRVTKEEFYINHGITRQVPLNDVLNQIRDFILETNEIIIVDIQEFPIGFGKDLTIHRKLVQFLKEKLGDLLVDPSLSWQVLLNDVWRRNQNIFLAYDHSSVVAEFPNVLFSKCHQRWGNVRDWNNLEKHLRRIQQYDLDRITSRPLADMAELTPDAWGVILDQYGGLRQMADDVNSKVSILYHELGTTANIVSVDFYR